jgi:hypothetical protein
MQSKQTPCMKADTVRSSDMSRFVNRTLATGLSILITAVAVAPAANARGWSYTGRAGRTHSRTYTPYNNGGGNFGRTITATRPNGQTATSSLNRSVNNGTITDTRTVTGFNGTTSTGTLTRTPGQGGTITRTGPNGQSFTGTYTP